MELMAVKLAVLGAVISSVGLPMDNFMFNFFLFLSFAIWSRIGGKSVQVLDVQEMGVGVCVWRGGCFFRISFHKRGFPEAVPNKRLFSGESFVFLFLRFICLIQSFLLLCSFALWTH